MMTKPKKEPAIGSTRATWHEGTPEKVEVLQNTWVDGGTIHLRTRFRGPYGAAADSTITFSSSADKMDGLLHKTSLAWDKLSNDINQIASMAKNYAQFKAGDHANPRIEGALFAAAVGDYVEKFRMSGSSLGPLNYGDILASFRSALSTDPKEQGEEARQVAFGYLQQKLKLDSFERELVRFNYMLTELLNQMSDIVAQTEDEEKKRALSKHLNLFQDTAGDISKGLNIAWLLTASKITAWRGLNAVYDYSAESLRKVIVEKMTHDYMAFERAMGEEGEMERESMKQLALSRDEEKPGMFVVLERLLSAVRDKHCLKMSVASAAAGTVLLGR